MRRYTKYRFNYGSKGIPLIELSRFWENNEKIFHSDYYKPPQNIRETTNHLFFTFVADRGTVCYVLIDKRTNSIQSIGKPQDTTGPIIIYSDEDSFYGYIDPGIIANYIEDGGELSETTFFKELDVSKFEKDGNPIIIKFSLP